MNCPACGHLFDLIGTVRNRDFDGSLFNVSGQFYQCAGCGFVRVETGLSDDKIAEHYTEFSLYSSLSGIGVGGDSTDDHARYAHYVDLMSAHGMTGGTLADIGCSRGGFIRYLAVHAPEIAAIGIDCDARALSALARAGHNARKGDVFALPFADGEKDMLSYFHVLEHVYDVDAVLAEAARTLRQDGALIIEVPDTACYFLPDSAVGPMFWLGMKEHVNHYSLASLQHFLHRGGCAIVDVIRSSLPMKSGKHYPSLLLLARRTREIENAVSGVDSGIGADFSENFQREVAAMQRLAEKIATTSVGDLCFWGIGLEFFALYGYLAPLLADRSVRLADRNPVKHGLTVDGRPVEPPEWMPVSGRLVCCSYMAGQQIREQAMALGWPSEAILCPS